MNAREKESANLAEWFSNKDNMKEQRHQQIKKRSGMKWKDTEKTQTNYVGYSVKKEIEKELVRATSTTEKEIRPWRQMLSDGDSTESTDYSTLQ